MEWSFVRDRCGMYRKKLEEHCLVAYRDKEALLNTLRIWQAKKQSPQPLWMNDTAD